MINYCYITTAALGFGEIAVEGRSADGCLLFGFRAMQDGFRTWRNKARDYTPSSYIPVFGGAH